MAQATRWRSIGNDISNRQCVPTISSHLPRPTPISADPAESGVDDRRVRVTRAHKTRTLHTHVYIPKQCCILITFITIIVIIAMSSFIFPPFHAFLRAHEETEARRPATAANGFGDRKRRTALFLSMYRRSPYERPIIRAACLFGPDRCGTARARARRRQRISDRPLVPLLRKEKKKRTPGVSLEWFRITKMRD